MVDGTAKAVYVGTGCILGDNVIVYPDVRLGNNVVVEAGTMLNQSVPEHAVLCPPQSLRICEARHSCITQIQPEFVHLSHSVARAVWERSFHQRWSYIGEVICVSSLVFLGSRQ